MDKKTFGQRLASLRVPTGVSARDMSLSLGQSPGYINNIENGGNYPSMAAFFSICDYLHVTPVEFLDTGTKHPAQLRELIEELRHLDAKELDVVQAVVRSIRK